MLAVSRSLFDNIGNKNQDKGYFLQEALLHPAGRNRAFKQKPVYHAVVGCGKAIFSESGQCNGSKSTTAGDKSKYEYMFVLALSWYRF